MSRYIGQQPRERAVLCRGCSTPRHPRTTWNRHGYCESCEQREFEAHLDRESDRGEDRFDREREGFLL